MMMPRTKQPQPVGGLRRLNGLRLVYMLVAAGVTLVAFRSTSATRWGSGSVLPNNGGGLARLEVCPLGSIVPESPDVLRGLPVDAHRTCNCTAAVASAGAV